MEGELDASVESEAEALSYRQRLEKSAGGEIVLMEWSPTMDLLAATFADNSVIVNRLSWQRVWSIPGQDSTPTALAWRPDGKVLAISRSDSSVSLVSVEHGRVLHTHTLTHPITCLHWMTLTEPSTVSRHCVKYKDRSLSYLSPLPSLEDTGSVDSTHRSPHDVKQLHPLSADEVDVLLAGDKAGVIHVLIGGVLLATSLGCLEEASKEGRGRRSEDASESRTILTCRLSRDLRLLSAIHLASSSSYGGGGGEGELEPQYSLNLKTVETSLMYDRRRELRHLSLHYSHICCLLDYTSDTLRCMHEAWEDILLTVDTKLAQYSKTLKKGTTVADELLVLLALGRVRSELQDFLVDELTAKGVRKIGLSLEMSYTRVRKYSFTCLSSAIQALQFHLCEVLGMARWREQFGTLGISTDRLQVCLNSLGTFALKNQELQLVIDESLKSMKAFFTWLYIVILKLEDEPIPPNMKQHLDAEELKLVMHFLKKRLVKSSAGGSQTFNLELIGQYLVDEDLKILPERSSPSFWEKLLQEAGLDSETVPWLFFPAPQKSLLQLLKSLTEDVGAAFGTTKEAISKTFVPKPALPLLKPLQNDDRARLSTKIGEFVSEGGRRCIYFPCGRDIILLMCSDQQQHQCCRFCVRDVPTLSDMEKSEEGLDMVDVMVYSAEALSVLFQYNSSERGDVLYSAVGQLPVQALMNLATDVPPHHDFECCACHDVGGMLTQVHSLGPFQATRLAVSGSRKLAAVVSRKSKKIRLFDVDAEEDEDEDIDESVEEGGGKEGGEKEQEGD